MENTRKWTGWILIAGILLVTLIVLGVYTLGGSQAGTDAALQQHEAEMRALFEQADRFERADSGEEAFVFRAMQGENVLGYAVRQTEQGYAGPVEVITGIASG